MSKGRDSAVTQIDHVGVQFGGYEWAQNEDQQKRFDNSEFGKILNFSFAKANNQSGDVSDRCFIELGNPGILNAAPTGSKSCAPRMVHNVA